MDLYHVIRDLFELKHRVERLEGATSSNEGTDELGEEVLDEPKVKNVTYTGGDYGAFYVASNGRSGNCIVVIPNILPGGKGKRSNIDFQRNLDIEKPAGTTLQGSVYKAQDVPSQFRYFFIASMPNAGTQAYYIAYSDQRDSRVKFQDQPFLPSANRVPNS